MDSFPSSSQNKALFTKQLNFIQKSIIMFVLKEANDKLSIILNRKFDSFHINISDYEKIDYDINEIRRVLYNIYKELDEYRTFKILIDSTINYCNLKESEHNFLTEFNQSKAKVQFMRDTLEKDYKTIKTLINTNQEKRMRVSQDIMDNSIDIARTQRYIEAASKADMDLVATKMNMENEIELNRLHLYEECISCEQVVAKSIQACYKKICENLEKELNHWSDTYDKENETFEIDKNILEDQIVEMNKDIELKTELLEKENDIIFRFFNKQKRILSAKRIQNWWRLCAKKNPKQLIETKKKRRRKKK